MKTPLVALLMIATLVSGCGFRDSSSNPFNWGHHRKAASATTEGGLAPKGGYKNTGDNRGLVASVESLAMERAPGGVIIRATGLPPTQGWWDAALKPDNGGRPVDGVLTYRFVISPPRSPAPESTVPSREISVGAFISDIKLQHITKIVVIGAGNSRTLGR